MNRMHHEKTCGMNENKRNGQNGCEHHKGGASLIQIKQNSVVGNQGFDECPWGHIWQIAFLGIETRD